MAAGSEVKPTHPGLDARELPETIIGAAPGLNRGMEGFLMASSTPRNTTPSRQASFQWLKHGPACLFLLVFCVFLSGCASITLGVVQDGQLVDGAAIVGVDVMRKGARSQPKNNMALEAGDEIRTNAQSTAVITYAEGARVYVQPNTHVRLGSIFVFIGEVLVKARGLFKVQTEYATAASEGTEYLVRVEQAAPEAHVRVVVAEDRVGLSSTAGRWSKTALGVGQAAWMVGPDVIELKQANVGEVEQIRARIRELDKLVPNTANLGTAALAAGIFAIGIGVMSSKSGDDPDRDRQRYPPRSPTHDDRIK